MSDNTVNGFDLTQAELLRGFEGSWVADLTADTDLPIVGPVTVSLLGQNYSGFVVTAPDSQKVASGAYAGQCQLRVVGGLGGLTRTILPDSRESVVLVRDLLESILGQVGEQLAPDCDPDLLAHQLPQWSWTRGTADGALGALTDYLGATWCIRADGKVWVGTYRGVPAQPFDYVLVDADLKNSRFVISADSVTLEPGQTFERFAVREVLHQLRADGARTVITFDPAPAAPLRQLLQRSNRRAMVDYRGPQPGKVAQQRADGSCTVQLDSDAFPPLRNVAIDTGEPDTQVTIQPGARVMVEFPGGVPTAPTITAWGRSTATKIKFGVSAPMGTEPTLKATTYRTAESALNTAIQSAYAGLPAAATDPASVITLANAIRLVLLGLGTGAYQNFEGKDATFKTTIVEVA